MHTPGATFFASSYSPARERGQRHRAADYLGRGRGIGRHRAHDHARNRNFPRARDDARGRGRGD